MKKQKMFQHAVDVAKSKNISRVSMEFIHSTFNSLLLDSSCKLQIGDPFMRFAIVFIHLIDSFFLLSFLEQSQQCADPISGRVGRLS